MRQSTIIFGTLLGAFVIYITIRGQLPAYLGLFTGRSGAGGGLASADSKEKDTSSNKAGTTSNSPFGDFSFENAFKNLGIGDGGFF